MRKITKDLGESITDQELMTMIDECMLSVNNLQLASYYSSCMELDGILHVDNVWLYGHAKILLKELDGGCSTMVASSCACTEVEHVIRGI